MLPFALSACCNKWQDDADELVEKQQRCAAGDTCALVHYYESVGNNCLGAFQCSAPLNESGLASFLDEAREISEDFERCNQCVQADCVTLDPETAGAVCNTDTGRCEIVSSAP
jgi:hypothetical protein